MVPSTDGRSNVRNDRSHCRRSRLITRLEEK
jgi:hypothetical protein